MTGTRPVRGRTGSCGRGRMSPARTADSGSFLSFLDATQAVHPRHRRLGPNLTFGGELGALLNRAGAQTIDRSTLLGRRVDRRAALRAERLLPLVAAFGGLHIDLRLAALQLEAVLLGHCDGAER